VLISCPSVSEQLELREQSFSDIGGTIHCHGGESIWTSGESMGAGANVYFTVWTSDYDAKISRELWPVSNAVLDDAERVIELLIVRYQGLQN
jgi:hypothetical protein